MKTQVKRCIRIKTDGTQISSRHPGDVAYQRNETSDRFCAALERMREQVSLRVERIEKQHRILNNGQR